MTSGSHVNSRKCTLAGMYGRKFFRYGLSGWNPTRSGNSCAAAASPGVITSLDIGYDLRLVLQSREKGLGKTRLLYTRVRALSKQTSVLHLLLFVELLRYFVYQRPAFSDPGRWSRRLVSYNEALLATNKKQ